MIHYNIFLKQHKAILYFITGINELREKYVF
jgi:hypothetical protein